ncbi:MAG: hypothetical protein LBC73_10025, partial [Oscillospiraceae bacterium]|nr:hypothetical protein [Oscillospiraceae bacterium]
GLYNVRRINSLNWGILGGVQALSFNENLVSDNITNYRYLINSSWYDRCIHDENYQPVDSGEDNISDNTAQNGTTSYLGEPVTLEEAKRTPGLYIKTNDGFIHVEPQWEYNMSQGYMSTQTISSVVAMNARGIIRGSGSASVFLPFLFNADFEIPKLPNNFQYVIIGITDIAIYEPAHTGWTIPMGLAFWDATRENLGGWWWISEQNKLLKHGWYINSGSTYDQEFIEVNGEAPTNYVHRMIYTGYYYLLSATHGILNASQNEKFTFSWMSGTDWVEVSYIADKRFFTLPTADRYGIQANYYVSETRNGYFEVIFITPPVGYYGIGHYAGNYDMVVEFVSP